MPSTYSKKLTRAISALLVLLCLRPASAQEMDAIKSLRAEFPSVRVSRRLSGIERLYSGPFSNGLSALESAERFRMRHAAVFDVSSAELRLIDGAGRSAQQPLMFDRQTGAYRMTLITYGQYRDGIPVFRSELRLVVRNEASFPLVLASSSLKDLGDFELEPHVFAAIADPATFADAFDKGRRSVQETAAQLTEFGPATVTVWAGTDKLTAAAPRTAISFEAANSFENQLVSTKKLFLTDFETGEVLYEENQLHSGDVSGNVSGWALIGVGSEFCEPELDFPMPYAEVSIPGSTTYTDIFGDYSLDTGGAPTVQVESPTRGLYFNVTKLGGSTVLSQNVSPPAVVDFVHNLVPSPVHRAEVNAYFYANKIRDYVLDANPAYPVIGADKGFPISVNETGGGFCPGNAQYTGVGMRFCAGGGGLPNTSWSSIIYHEYGHHVVETSGSGQGQYGEGVADALSVLLLDDPRIGLGLMTNCQTVTRSADNTFMYPCADVDPHVCGNVLSGCVWDTREALAITEPLDGLQIIGDLLVNSVLLHAGSSITPAITIDFLTLDDDDADIGNGTPHSSEILSGFGAHNMAPLEPPSNNQCIDAIAACPGVMPGTTFGALPSGSSTCAQSNPSPDVWYRYSPMQSGSVTVSLCGAGTNYDSAISVHTGCPGQVFDEIACDDDGCGPTFGPSEVSFIAAAGETYFIRVMGFLGSVGDFELQIFGPPCVAESPEALRFRFPEGRPAQVAANVPRSIPVEVKAGTEHVNTTTAMLHHRNDGGTYQSIPMTWLGGDLFEAVLPPSMCTDSPEYYFSAEGDGGTLVKAPPTAPADVYTTFVGATKPIFEDDFETDKGWTVSGSVFEGDWERGIPVNNNRGDPDSDFDGSGQCYLTENDPSDPNSDVDGGTTILTSPPFDLNTGGVISYAYWIDAGPGSFDEDYLLTSISIDPAGSIWFPVRAHTIAQPIWKNDAILVGTEVPASATIRIRFSATDLSIGTIVEAAIDDVRAEAYSCGISVSCADGLLNQGEIRIDCGGPCDPCECTSDDACDDGLFCDGSETCDEFGACVDAIAPCDVGQWCRESNDQCVPFGDGDFDIDGDVDLKDFAVFQTCFGSMAAGLCEKGNLSGSGIIDLEDFAIFEGLLLGP